MFSNPLAMQQATPAITAAVAGVLMVRAAASKKMIVLRAPSRCAVCGRRLTRGRCSCTR
jgi:hypothetical protein